MILYDIGFLIFSLFYIPTLIFKGKLHKDFLERFGVYDDIKLDRLFRAKDVIWIQAVSVGEVALCKSLIPLVKREFPEHSIVLSTITKTGNDLAKKLFSGEAEVVYFPLDFSFTAKKAIGKIRPKLYIMIETEIWPNVLRALRDKRVPAVLINGRISDRSYGKYKLVKRFLANTLDDIAIFCMQSDVDARRIISIGAKADRVRVTGTMKFDIDALLDVTPSSGVKEMFGLTGGERIFVAGSTHGGEEEAVVSAYKDLIAEHPGLKLIIAPRHIDRVAEVENIINRLGLKAVRMSRERSDKEPGSETGSAAASGPDKRSPYQVYIMDKIGYLNDAYSIAEIVFIGGSLIPHGGQNPIEPAVFEKPIVFGPYMFNFRTVASLFLKNDAAMQVKSGEELYSAVDRILKDADAGIALGKNAKKVITENRGASLRNLSAIEELTRG